MSGLSVGTENRKEGSVGSLADGVGRRRMKGKQEYDFLLINTERMVVSPKWACERLDDFQRNMMCLFLSVASELMEGTQGIFVLLGKIFFKCPYVWESQKDTEG